MKTSADVVVIGGGIMGTAIAYHLARRKIDVLLVEQGEVGRGQSTRAWGFVRQQGRDPAELPLMVAANRIWPELSAELGVDLEWTQHGVLAIADTDERLASFRDWATMARDQGLDTRILSGRAIAELIPAMRGTWLGGMYTPSDGHAEPTKVPGAFADAARRLGATIVTGCAATAIEVSGNQVSAVQTDRGTIRAPTVVCAAGTGSSRIARGLGLRLPQIAVRNSVAETTLAQPITPIAVSIRGGGLAFRQRPGGSFYIATVETSDYDVTLDSFRYARQFLPNYRKNRALFRMHIGRPLLRDIGRAVPGTPARRRVGGDEGVEPPVNRQVVAASRQQLTQLFPELAGIEVQRSWAGLIDATPDAIPVLGAVDRPQGFIVATGFSGHGFALGPIVGQLIAELIVDGRTFIDISSLRFERFAEKQLANPKAVI